MKDSVTPLYPNEQVAKRVTQYSEEHSDALPKHITDYHDDIVKNHPRSDYMISDFQSQAHTFFARAIGAKRILEIGVFVGYSSLGWAHAVGEDGVVTGLEFEAEYAEASREIFKKCGVKNVEIIQGDAIET